MEHVGTAPVAVVFLLHLAGENAEILRNCSLQGKYVELNNDK